MSFEKAVARFEARLRLQRMRARKNKDLFLAYALFCIPLNYIIGHIAPDLPIESWLAIIAAESALIVALFMVQE